MLIKVLEQGLTSSSSDSIGNILIGALISKKYNNLYAFSAFASRAGIRGLSSSIQSATSNGMIINIIVGVDQKGTSKAALKSIRRLKVNSFVFYQRAPSIYHPKMYFFEGKDESLLIVGSSNLTSQGLFSNIETSVHIQLDNYLKEDADFIQDVKNTYTSLFNLNDPNLQKITKSLIKNLVKAGIVPTEKERKASHFKNKKTSSNSAKAILNNLFPSRASSKIPQVFRSAHKKKKAKVKPQAISSKSKGLQVTAQTSITKLLWESKPLTERDLAIPKGSNTNPTGSMLFKKGITVGIDHRHYFRDTVFVNLTWTKDSRPNQHKERAIGNFEIWINNVNKGTYDLRISHDTRTNTTTYNQKNSVTQISWGETKSIIGDPTLLGKKLELYSINSTNTKFKIVIQ